MDDVYQSVVALCCVSVSMLLVIGTLLGAFLALKIYSLYNDLFVSKRKDVKK